MPRCSICDHDQRAEIEVAIATKSVRHIAKRFAVSPSAVQRHKTACGRRQVSRLAASRESQITDDTLERLDALLETVDGLLKKALSKGTVADATKVIREAHALLATRGRILGAFPKDATTIDNRRQYVFTGMSDDMVRALCDPVKGARMLEYASSGLHDGNTSELVGTQTLVESEENAQR